MKISELIEELNKQKALHGDSEVKIYSSNHCGCILDIDEISFKKNEILTDDYGAYCADVAILSNYDN